MKKLKAAFALVPAIQGLAGLDNGELSSVVPSLMSLGLGGVIGFSGGRLITMEKAGKSAITAECLGIVYLQL